MANLRAKPKSQVKGSKEKFEQAGRMVLIALIALLNLLSLVQSSSRSALKPDVCDWRGSS